MGRKNEIAIVIAVLAFISFFMLYKWYFNGYCSLMSGKNETNYLESITTIAECRDSFVCEYKNPEINNKNEVVSWTCEKKIFERLEWDFYKREFNNIFN